MKEKIEWPVVDYTGAQIGSVNLDPNAFGLEADEIHAYAIQAAVKTYLANCRQATAKTKVRSEVSGSGKKLWRQKGTGRARMGDRRSPIWVHGGTVFGPTGNQNFKLKLNKKVNALALSSALSDKVLDNALVVLTDAPFESHRTRDFAKALKAINGGDKKTLLVLGDCDMNLILAASNIPNVEIVTSDNVSVYDVVNAQSLIVVKSALIDPTATEEAK